MGAAYFYHLTRSSLEATLPRLLVKARQAGWRVAVRGKAEDRLDWLDENLWLGPEEGFLAHGRAGGPFDADQPILLTTGTEMPNGAECVMSIDGANVTTEDVDRLARVCILFDGADGNAVEHARTQWRTLTSGGAVAQYWSEEGGGWAKKADSASASP